MVDASQSGQRRDRGRARGRAEAPVIRHLLHHPYRACPGRAEAPLRRSAFRRVAEGVPPVYRRTNGTAIG